MARHYIHPTATIGELSNKQVLELTSSLSHMKIENDLRREILDNIRRLKDSGTYRGRRHALNLPVRGQNTKSQVRLIELRFCISVNWMPDKWLMDIQQIKTALKLNSLNRRL